MGIALYPAGTFVIAATEYHAPLLQAYHPKGTRDGKSVPGSSFIRCMDPIHL